ncbi:MAG: class I SAM-dependent methyltransferase [Thermodesulfobacteriota bacterium]
MSSLSEKESEELIFWTKHSVFAKKASERGKPSKRVYNKYLDILSEPAGNLRGKTIIDVGCGPMGTMHFFPGSLKVGLDPLALHYQNAFDLVRHQDMQYIAARAENIPVADEVADYVFCVNAIDHVDDPRAVAAELTRVLKPGGKLLIQVEINKPSPTTSEPHVLSPEVLDDMFASRFVSEKSRTLWSHRKWWMRRRWWFTDLIGFYPRYHDIFIVSYRKKLHRD